MVSRVEIFLGLTILFFVTQEIYTQATGKNQDTVIEKKELELSNATLYEANQTHIQNIITTSHMVVYPEKTLFDDLNLSTSTVSLSAKKALLKDEMIIFEENTTVYQKDGTQYYSQIVRYDKEKRILLLPQRFKVRDQYGNMQGKALEYNVNQGILTGKSVNASYEIK